MFSCLCYEMSLNVLYINNRIICPLPAYWCPVTVDVRYILGDILLYSSLFPMAVLLYTWWCSLQHLPCQYCWIWVLPSFLYFLINCLFSILRNLACKRYYGSFIILFMSTDNQINHSVATCSINILIRNSWHV